MKNRFNKILLLLIVFMMVLVFVPQVFAVDNNVSATDSGLTSSVVCNDSLNQVSSDYVNRDNLSVSQANDSNGLDESSSDTIYVSTAGKDSIGYGNQSNPYRTISYAVNVASDNSTILIKQGTYFEHNILVNKSLTITGLNNVIINAQGSGSIFLIYGDNNVNINNIYLMNGKSTNGGAIIVNNNKTCVNGCYFMNNAATTSGGAIYTSCTDLILEYNTFYNNSAKFASNIYNTGNVVADYNWWATNNQTVINQSNFNVTVNKWVILSLYANSHTILSGVAAQITASLNSYSDGINTGTLNGVIYDNNVQLTSVNGVLPQKHGVITGNSFTTSYSNSNIGNDTISATVNNQTVYLNLKIVNKIVELYVSTIGDDNTGDGSQNKPYRTINKALTVNSESGGSGIIHIESGTYNENNLVINDSLTILGSGASKTIINGNNNKLFTTSTGNTVVFEDLTFENGQNTYGGAIDNNAKLIIINSIFKNNTAQYGGAISNENNLTLANCTFLGNTAQNNGGAVNSNGYQVYISNCTFMNNTAKLKDGGAVNVENNGILTVTKSIFISNIAPWGGAICIFKSNGTIIKSTFTNNTGTDYGACVYVNGYLNSDDNSMTNGVSKNGTCIYMTKNSGINEVNIVCENNQTYTIQHKSDVTLFAKVTDNNGNSISGSSISFSANSKAGTVPINEGFAYYDCFMSKLGYAILDQPGTYWVKGEMNATKTNLSIGTIIATYIGDSSTILNGDNFVENYGDGANYTVKLTDLTLTPMVGQHIALNLTRLSDGASKVYWVTTDTEGYTSLQINLSPGYYSINASYAAKTGYINSTIQNNVTIYTNNQKATVLVANEFNQPFGAGANFTGKLMDANGNALVGQHIALNLTRLSNGASKVYWVTTDTLGEFQLAINLGVGKYSVLASFAGVSKYQASSSGLTSLVVY